MEEKETPPKRRETFRFEVRHMMDSIRKRYLSIVTAIGGYRLQEWSLERQRRKEVHRMLQEAARPA